MKKTKEEIAVKIIKKNTNYTDAYSEMLDNGFEECEAGMAWEKHMDQCGDDA